MSDRFTATHAEELEACDRVLRSKSFSGSETNRKILKFIVEKSLSGSLGDIKEYTIATEALGRSGDFDPRIDNIVRVQAQRLRRKLEEYYSGAGANDIVRIIIPRGHYTPEFHILPPKQRPAIAGSIQTSGVEHPSAKPAKSVKLAVLWGLVTALIIVVTILSVSLSRSVKSISIPPASKENIPLPSSAATLWEPLLSSNSPVLIVYSNPVFLASDRGDLYRRPRNLSSALPVSARVGSLAGLERHSPIPPGVGELHYCDLYTGAGEVVAAARVAQLLASHNREFSIKRSETVSYEDVKSSDVIFIGSPSENSIVEELPVDADLTFEPARPDSFWEGEAIHDCHPAAGGQGTYRVRKDGKTGMPQSEYAVISLLPALVPGRYTLVLAGISTLGTQAAAEFATSPSEMATLEKIRASSGNNGARSSYFQALLGIQIRDGVAAKAECILVRELCPKPNLR